MNRNIMNMKKKDIKENRESVLKTNENKFEIRELPDNPGSNYSSVKKESNIREDLVSDQQISGKEAPLKLKDFVNLQEKTAAVGTLFGNLVEYFNFEMTSKDIIDMVAGSKPTMDESYHQFVMSYKKCLSFGEKGPTFEEAEKASKEDFDWERMKKDCREIKLDVDMFYETIQVLLKKKMDFRTAKNKVKSFDSNKMVDFVLEKYKKTKTGSGTELFESNLKETKEPQKTDFNFEMENGEDFFEKAKESPKKEINSFALDQENDAFTDFNSKKKKVQNQQN